jgi:hypothetical protein
MKVWRAVSEEASLDEPEGWGWPAQNLSFAAGEASDLGRQGPALKADEAPLLLEAEERESVWFLSLNARRPNQHRC